jgi:hypothetical protein
MKLPSRRSVRRSVLDEPDDPFKGSFRHVVARDPTQSDRRSG